MCFTYGLSEAFCFYIRIMREFSAEKTQVTELLTAWNNGEESALTQLLPIVEVELRRIAHNYMRRERETTRCKPLLWLMKPM